MKKIKDYTVGWICALSTELVAARQFLEEEHQQPPSVDFREEDDDNSYTRGRIGKHNVVLAVLPIGQIGITAAASVIKDMIRTFPKLRMILMVGVAGGAPSEKHDIRLGDIVVSTPGNGYSGVIQYDFGKTMQGQRFEMTGALSRPPTLLLTAANALRARHESDGHTIEETINQVLQRNKRLKRNYSRPALESDRLYKSHITHPQNDDRSCEMVCGHEPLDLVSRTARTADDDNPSIHYGLIASANQVLRDAVVRDHLSADHGALCFEMEAAGLMNQFPGLVIRGICDYSDSHKNKTWQGYAAMVAAAYASELLRSISSSKVEAEQTIGDLLSSIQESLEHVQEVTQDTHIIAQELNRRSQDQESQVILDWLTPLDYSFQQSDFITKWQEGTGEWLLKSHEFQNWLNQPSQTLFCPGMPGAGKTIATSMVINHLQNKYRDDLDVGVTYTYCNFRRQHEQTSTDLFSSMLKQLTQQKPHTPETITELYHRHNSRQTRPTEDEILAVLRTVITSYSRTFIIIDALDEWEASFKTRAGFLSQLFGLQTVTSANIFATSRFIQDIEKAFEKKPKLEIRAHHADVKKYVNTELLQSRSIISENIPLRAEIVNRIALLVDGMFLLAQLYVKALADKITPKAIRSSLQELEIESKLQVDDRRSRLLDRAYEKAMERIETQPTGFKNLAMLVLSWITFAQRPLSPLELQHALAIEPGTSDLDKDNIPRVEDMVFVCAGLVTVDATSDTIRLVHYTTQDFLERGFIFWFPTAKENLVRSCLTYLCFDVFRNGMCKSMTVFKKRISDYPLYLYASQYWGWYAEASCDCMLDQVLGFLSNDTLALSSSQALLGPGEDVNGKLFSQNLLFGVHLAAYFGLEKAMAAFLMDGCDPDLKTDDGRTPLSFASEKGHYFIVKGLLATGNVDVNSKSLGKTPLSLAAENKHRDVVNALIGNVLVKLAVPV